MRMRELKPTSYKNAKQQRRPALQVVMEPRIGTRIRGIQNSCPFPVVKHGRDQRLKSLARADWVLKERSEWRHHCEADTRPAMVEGLGPGDIGSGSSADQLQEHSGNSLGETWMVPKTGSDRSSAQTTNLGSTRILCLPRSSRKILKAGNVRLKRLIKPQNKTCFRTQRVLADGSGDIKDLLRLELTTSRTRRYKQGSGIERTIVAADRVADRADGLPEEPWVGSSNASILDLNEVESRHRLEKYHWKALSSSWDELWRSMSGFDAATRDVDDSTQSTSGDQLSFAETESNALRLGRSSIELPTEKCKPSNPLTTVPVKAPPSPGPRTSSISTTTTEIGPVRHDFQVAGWEAGVKSHTPSRPRMGPVKEEDAIVAEGRDLPLIGPNHRHNRQQARSLINCFASRTTPLARQPPTSAKEIDPIEAEGEGSESIVPAVVTDPLPLLDINCTPSISAIAPTAPPSSPLPDLPKVSDRADVASRDQYHPPSLRRLSRPPTSPRSHHTRGGSSNSRCSNLTICPSTPNKGVSRKPTNASTRSPKKASLTRNFQNVRRQETGTGASCPKVKTSTDSNANTVSSSQHILDSPKALPSPAFHQICQEDDMVVGYEKQSLKSLVSTKEILRARSEQTKDLKIRDLATEKANRTRVSNRPCPLHDGAVAANSSNAIDNKTKSPAPQRSSTSTVIEKPPAGSDARHTRTQKKGSRQKETSHQHRQQPRGSYSTRLSQETTGSIVSRSQIMVLAETDPDTQTFRAATPTGSLRRAGSRKAEAGVVSSKKKIQRQGSRQGARSQTRRAPPPSSPVPSTQSSKESTPLPSLQSSPSSRAGTASLRQSKSSLNVDSVAALVKPDSDLESGHSKRALAVLACKEARRDLTEQHQLRKLKRESTELKLAMELLDRGLEKLTTFVETNAQLGHSAGPVDCSPETRARKQIESDFTLSFRPGAWRELDQPTPDSLSHSDVDKAPFGNHVGSLRRRSARNQSNTRPISLMSRYCRFDSKFGQDLLPRQPVTNDAIWSQLDTLNRASLVRRVLAL